MNEAVTKKWVLPALIPFSDLKGKDLEECIYWLFDGLGAKDLEWRTGGSGGGAADGGRDLEAHFYTPGADSEIESQTWWIECKGRSGTVEADEVKSAVINAQAKADLDYIVVATNTQFSNPTRDWIKQWQSGHSRPKVKLWDHSHLERLLSKHPDVVLRLFSQALSLDGRFQAMESRFWNKLEFVPPSALVDFWKARQEFEFTALGMFAAIANEFAHGNIVRRPWGANLSGKDLLEVLGLGLVNVTYLVTRCHKGGVEQKPICRTLGYLILCALSRYPAKVVTDVVENALYYGDAMPEGLREILLVPIANQLLAEIQDVCTSDCRRMMAPDHQVLTADRDEVEDYWLRFERAGIEMPDEKNRLLIEVKAEPCIVGFPVDDENACPLFKIEPNPQNLGDLLSIIERVAAFRKRQDKEKRAAREKMMAEPLSLADFTLDPGI